MKALENLPIETTVNNDLQQLLQYNIDQKTKPLGSLGQLEELAMQIGLIQQSTTPTLSKPVMLTIASDHEITAEGISPAPAEITWQQCLNFVNGGGGIGFLCRQFGFDLHVVDAGVNYDFEPHPKLIDKKVRKASRNFLHEPAMTLEECNQALQNGRDVVASFAEKGTNVIGFGEMGIGNSSPASALLSIYAGIPIENCVGPGCGLLAEGVQHKAEVLKQAIQHLGIANTAEENLARFGGLEIATIAGGMLEAASRRMLIIVDGFITTSGFLAAHAINPLVRDYAVFSHCSHEPSHKQMLHLVDGNPILDLQLRLGEGTGAALCYPIVQASVEMLRSMTSFSETKVYNITHKHD
ncbi:MAG: nicotinate-nucleotide--dimethylbenzimidazole phosphoribosyltransferase [Mangrovibacterium sp.]